MSTITTERGRTGDSICGLPGDGWTFDLTPPPETTLLAGTDWADCFTSTTGKLLSLFLERCNSNRSANLLQDEPSFSTGSSSVCSISRSQRECQRSAVRLMRDLLTS